MDILKYRTVLNPYEVEKDLVRFVTFKDGVTIYTFDHSVHWKRLSDNSVYETENLAEELDYHIAKKVFATL